MRWRKIRRAPKYKVSNRGHVKGPGGPLTPFPDRDGYLRVNLHGEQVLVHVLVLEAFHGPRPYGQEGLHGPGGCQDNRAEVLRWGTHEENEKDKRDKRRTERKDEWEVGTRPYLPRTFETADVG